MLKNPALFGLKAFGPKLKNQTYYRHMVFAKT